MFREMIDEMAGLIGPDMFAQVVRNTDGLWPVHGGGVMWKCSVVLKILSLYRSIRASRGAKRDGRVTHASDDAYRA